LILIRLCGCAGWSASMLVENALRWFCRDAAQILYTCITKQFRRVLNSPFLKTTVNVCWIFSGKKKRLKYVNMYFLIRIALELQNIFLVHLNGTKWNKIFCHSCIMFVNHVIRITTCIIYLYPSLNVCLFVCFVWQRIL
jgi:hypothetical protein